MNPTLTDLMGGIQRVTLSDEEARRRRSQKTVLERKAPPTFDVIVEILDREKVTVHADVAETVDSLLRGDPISAELRWRDEGGVHRSQSRPKPSPREALSGGDRFGSDRFAGLVGAGPGWRTEPGWRGAGSYHAPSDWRDSDRGGVRPGYRPGAGGGWRAPARGAREVREGARRSRGDVGSGGPGSSGSAGGGTGAPGPAGFGGAPGAPSMMLPGERFAMPPFAPGKAGGPDRASELGWPGDEGGAFRADEIADRGPVERGAAPVLEPRARELRELERQRSWAQSATRALNDYRAEGVGEEEEPEAGTSAGLAGPAAMSEVEREDIEEASGGAEDDEALADVVRLRAAGTDEESGGPALRIRQTETILPTLRVLPHGISRKRLEQAINGSACRRGPSSS